MPILVELYVLTDQLAAATVAVRKANTREIFAIIDPCLRCYSYTATPYAKDCLEFHTFR